MSELIQDSDELFRQLTSIDVDQALYTLNMNQKPIISSDNQISTVVSNQECNCCRLLRTNPSSRFLLPLARRDRPHLSNRSTHFLCSNCQKIKHEQEITILENEEKFKQKNIYQTIINFDLSTEEQLALNNHQYQSAQMLVWKINHTMNGNTIDLSYDTNSLNDNEKKILLDDTIKKLQIILNNRSTTTTTTTADHNQDNIDFTYQTLQTTINILSASASSHNSI